MKTGLEILKAPDTTAGEIADIMTACCPPFCESTDSCGYTGCRECWLAWLTTGKPPIPKKDTKR